MSAENVAIRFLKMDSSVEHVNPEMFKTLNDVMDDACSRIKTLPRLGPGEWDPVYAESALRSIDDALVSHGFVYPDVGGEDLLADGLTPFQMKPARRISFEARDENLRRKAAIERRFPGPFYPVDCWITCLIFLGVADLLNLPIHVIDLPGFDGQHGHNFVRWRQGVNFVDWETTLGCVEPDELYRANWNISADEIKTGSALTDLTPGQILGHYQATIAMVYANHGDFERALAELQESLRLCPHNLFACGDYGWYTAAAAKLRRRDYPGAIAVTKFSLGIVDDPDTRDTLASLYASEGRFSLAVDEERLAASESSVPDYKARLKLFQHHEAFRETQESPNTNLEFKP